MADRIESIFLRLDQRLSGRCVEGRVMTATRQRPRSGRSRSVQCRGRSRTAARRKTCKSADPGRARLRSGRSRYVAGGHDWAGRALCDGIVIDLTAMKRCVNVEPRLSRRTDFGRRPRRRTFFRGRPYPSGLAVVTGSCSSVGMTGLDARWRLRIANRPLRARAFDNLLDAEVRASRTGRIVTRESPT